MPTELVPLIARPELDATIARLADAISRDYGDHPIVVLGVLKGSFMFMADLIRAIQTPIRSVEFIRLSSYGSGTVSSGTVTMQIDLPPEAIAQQHVLLVEDIVDTGLSTSRAIAALQAYQPASLKLCSLLSKPDRRKIDVAIDYLGLTVPDRFIVGYGIDFDEQYRQLSGIYTLEESPSSLSA